MQKTTKQPTPNKDVLTLSDLGAYFGRSRTQIYKWRKAGQIPGPAFSIGNCQYWTRPQLNDFVEKKIIKNATETAK